MDVRLFTQNIGSVLLSFSLWTSSVVAAYQDDTELIQKRSPAPLALPITNGKVPLDHSNLLFRRQSTCLTGQDLCNNLCCPIIPSLGFSSCCTSTPSYPNGFCAADYPVTCCDRVTCDADQECCGTGCMPGDARCCANGQWCEAGNICVLVGSATRCCTNTSCRAYVENGLTVSLSTSTPPTPSPSSTRTISSSSSPPPPPPPSPSSTRVSSPSPQPSPPSPTIITSSLPPIVVTQPEVTVTVSPPPPPSPSPTRTTPQTTTTSTTGITPAAQPTSTNQPTIVVVANANDPTTSASATNGGVVVLTTQISAITSSTETPDHPTSTWDGSGAILQNYCATASFSEVADASATAYYYAGIIGCINEKPDCCPKQFLDNGAVAAKAEYSFPTPTIGASEMLPHCPDDYEAISGLCCPRGFSLWNEALGGQIPCYSTMSAYLTPPPQEQVSSTRGPVAPAAPTSTVINIVYARNYPMREATGLSTGAKAGIGAGAGAAGLCAIGGLVFLLFRRYKKKNEEAAAYGGGYGYQGNVAEVHNRY